MFASVACSQSPVTNSGRRADLGSLGLLQTHAVDHGDFGQVAVLLVVEGDTGFQQPAADFQMRLPRARLCRAVYGQGRQCRGRRRRKVGRRGRQCIRHTPCAVGTRHTECARYIVRWSVAEPDLELFRLSHGELRRFAHDVANSQQPIGLELCFAGGKVSVGGISRSVPRVADGRGGWSSRAPPGFVQPEVDLLRVQLAHGLGVQRCRSDERNNLVLLLRADLELRLPAGLKLLAGPVGHVAAEPARPAGQQFEHVRMVLRPRHVAKARRMDFVAVPAQHDFLAVAQIDLAADQTVLAIVQVDLTADQVILQRSGRSLNMVHRRVQSRG